MLDMKIEDVAYSVDNLMEILDVPMVEIWDNYIHPTIKEKYTLEQVEEYIKG